jgi:hypothetical protein
VIIEQSRDGMSDKERVLVAAVEWVLNDAMFKAPEQVGPVAERWIDRLTRAMNEYKSEPEMERDRR